MFFIDLLLLVLDDEVQHGATAVRPSAQMKSDAVRGYLDESRRFRNDRFRAFRTCV